MVIIGIANFLILITCVWAQCDPYYALILKNDIRFFLAMLPSIILIPLGFSPPLAKTRRISSLYSLLIIAGIFLTLYNLIIGHFTGIL